MGKKHHRKHHRQEKDERNKDDDERSKVPPNDDIDDDAASNSTADSIADDDCPSSQDSEEKSGALTGIKLVLKMNNSDPGGTSDVYSPSHVYSPASHDERRRKHKKKKKKKSSDRDRHRHYQDVSPSNSDDQRLTPIRVAINTSMNSEDNEPAAKRIALDGDCHDSVLDETLEDVDETLEKENEDSMEDRSFVIKDDGSGRGGNRVVDGDLSHDGKGRAGDEDCLEDRSFVGDGDNEDKEDNVTNDEDNDADGDAVEGRGVKMESESDSQCDEYKARYGTDENSQPGSVNSTAGDGCYTVKKEKRVEEGGASGMLKPLLTHLLKHVTKLDVHGIFAYPVNDLIAPGYSTFITQPMDLSTIQSKIGNSQYNNVADLKSDVDLMCSNAMAYNQADTIYYKEAARLQQYATKLMSKEKLLKMVRTHSFLAGVTIRDLGLDQPSMDAVVPLERLTDTVISQHTVPSPKPVKGELSEDTMTPEDILAQAQAAAAGAAQRLTLRQPHSRFGFLRRREDGSTSFNIVNPDNDGIVSETERHIDIESLIGKLSSGSTSVAGFKEDRQNKVTTINYLNYGPYSSFAPQYDSSFANVSKEESDLLLSTYKDEIGVSYAKSVLSFVDSAGDYAVKMVNQLLDMLTKGEHSKTQRLQEEKKMAEEEESRKKAHAAMISANQTTDINYDSLESLKDLGIDTSFLPYFRSVDPTLAPRDPLQQELDSTATLIHKLEQSQSERLSQAPPADLNAVSQPSSEELQLANEVCNKLKDISKQMVPGDISSTEGIRKAMGITTHPIKSAHSLPPDTVQPMEISNKSAVAQQNDDDLQSELQRLLDESAGVNTDCPPLVVTNDNLLEQLC